MTVTVNDSLPVVTDGHVSPDVRAHVRGPEIPGQASRRGDSVPRSTGTHAISRLRGLRPLSDARIFVSLNVTELAAEGASGWGATEQPQPLVVTWRQVIPRRDEVSGWLSWVGGSLAGLFRALVHTGAYLAYFSTATRKRSAVMGGVTAALACIYVVGHLVG